MHIHKIEYLIKLYKNKNYTTSSSYISIIFYILVKIYISRSHIPFICTCDTMQEKNIESCTELETSICVQIPTTKKNNKNMSKHTI